MFDLFTHDDLDGVGCAVLATLWAKKLNEPIEVHYCTLGTINRNVNAFLDEHKKTDRILITDISVDPRTAQRLNSLKKAQKDRLQLLDHHPAHPDMPSYPWMTVNTAEDVCGTSLLYDVCPEHLYDTWRFDQDILSYSEKLNFLHEILGHEAFVEMALDDLEKGQPFRISYYWEQAIHHRMEERDLLCRRKERAMHVIEFEGCQTAVVYADQDISSLADYVLREHPEIEIAAVIYMPSGVSLRTKREDIDLTKIAWKYGGGGHPKAAAFRFDSAIVPKITELIMGS